MNIIWSKLIASSGCSRAKTRLLWGGEFCTFHCRSKNLCNRSQAGAARKWKTLILGLKEFSMYLGWTRHTQTYCIFYPLSLHFPPLHTRVKSSSLEAMWPWASYLPFLDLSLFISKMGIRLVPPSSCWFKGQRRCLKGFARCLNASW